MNYRELDINQRINLKGLFAAWTDITVDRFRKELDRKVYSRYDRRTRSRVSRATRTGELRTNWRQQVRMADLSSGGIMISFLKYGRFVDMGVGKGVDYALSKYSRVRANGDPIKRRPKRWYAKRKAYEVHRLRELMVRYYVNIPVDLLENALTTSINITI
ncbi:hypothetical protein [Arsenicibacter rosenii]|uniref:Uncharacterized protein n=1 Tax=Arsenicibacter rosenii TaxID=1750698 RepID=A0A1S2VGS7_9BACT|nr:hypothetical protein [Arsenicibacter rosenii]OIN57620.1 hypothetical protein BLX24_19275 [Arsenicibacter rosenii]